MCITRPHPFLRSHCDDARHATPRVPCPLAPRPSSRPPTSLLYPGQLTASAAMPRCNSPFMPASYAHLSPGIRLPSSEAPTPTSVLRILGHGISHWHRGRHLLLYHCTSLYRARSTSRNRTITFRTRSRSVGLAAFTHRSEASSFHSLAVHCIGIGIGKASAPISLSCCASSVPRSAVRTRAPK